MLALITGLVASGILSIKRAAVGATHYNIYGTVDVRQYALILTKQAVIKTLLVSLE